MVWKVRVIAMSRKNMVHKENPMIMEHEQESEQPVA
jgi:hypothetical protein